MPPHHPVLDPAVAYPKIAGLRTALDDGDWPACRGLLDPAEPAERTALIQAGADEPGLEDFLRGVLRADPADGAAGALLGRHLINVGWEVHAEERAEPGCPECFRKAERVLISAAAHSPGDHAVWVSRLITARRLELGRSEARRRYDRLAELDPHHLPGQVEFLHHLTPRRGGSWERAHRFAVEAAEDAPPGAHQPVLIAEVHLGRWRETGRGHLAGETVRAELYDAAHHAVWHPDFRRTHGWVEVVSTFAMVFALLDDQQAAASLFAELGELDSAHPWNLLGDPATVITKYRRNAERAAGGDR
ncbi:MULTISPECIES: hypothetical protein [Actinoplanes]|uniref:hypothetical protein n=1 Tax=Actinoplanes TaxID=1865 RepID=UPI001B80636B|nr:MULTISPECIES: hypothetical protein [Actinoplanes]